MPYRRIGRRTALLLAVALALGMPSRAPGQAVPGGVVVDAQGVLQLRRFADPGGQLMQERVAAAKASLGPKVTVYSKLRKVSITRLEQIIRQHQGVPTDEMRYLAGLLRIRYVFLYPDSKDIVIAGPAEGWLPDASGRVVGITGGRPTIELQDLIVALRAFPPGGDATRLIGCSIDPTEEGLAAMQQFVRSVGSQITPADTQPIVQGLQTSLGLQMVSIHGVSPKTHFAQVMVEADYRMKLIGIGLERPPVKLVSYVDRATPSDVGRNALERWFFTPDYQCVRTAADGLAMELVGDGVKLVGEQELVTAGGQRQSAGRVNKASQLFVANFTKQYPNLAEHSPVFAQLRNLIDLAVAAAFMQQDDYYGKAAWRMDLFGNEKSFAVETYNVPRQAAPAVNALRKGNRLMTPVGGGVQIDAVMALNSDKLLSDDQGKVAKTRQETKLNLAKDQWWWD